MNCGNNNHDLKDCNYPIKSYGIILFRFNNDKKKFEYLLICRKDSLGYVDFIRGKYDINNCNHIQRLIDEMTIDEKNNLLNNNFNEIWDKLWNKCDKKYNKEKKQSQISFHYLKNNGLLKKYIDNSKTSWNDKEWGFPKGRRNYKESDIQTSIRETIEETNIDLKNIKIIENINPIQEIFIGSNYKSYSHIYFLAKYIENDKDINIHNKIRFNNNSNICNNDNYITKKNKEVSKIKWMDLEEAREKIRYYNNEKIIILEKINLLLNTSIIIDNNKKI